MSRATLISLVLVGAALPTWPAGATAADFPPAALHSELGPFGFGRTQAARPHACAAEFSPSGNFQVNCMHEDQGILRDSQLAQSETSVVADGSKVVAAFNDEYQGVDNPASLAGCSVSHDGGVKWTDIGAVPDTAAVQPFSDPSLALDQQGNIWFTTLAIDHLGPTFKLGLWEMPARSNTFHLVPTPIVAPGRGFPYAIDKPLMAIARDGQGHRHFYISYTQYNGTSPGLIQGPVVLADSTDGGTWRKTQLTESSLCEPATPSATPVADANTVYVFFNDIAHAACANDPNVNPTVTSGREEVIAVDVRTGAILHRTTVAAIHGNGELVEPNCGSQQVIETTPGLEGRNASLPAPTLGPDGVLYLVWSDRPNGEGGPFSNATRIYLSYSRDDGASWSPPHVISGPLSTTHMADRFQPALTADAHGLDHRQRDPLARHLDRMRVALLMRSEPPPHARRERETTQLGASRGCRPRASARRTVDHAEHRTDGRLQAML